MLVFLPRHILECPKRWRLEFDKISSPSAAVIARFTKVENIATLMRWQLLFGMGSQARSMMEVDSDCSQKVHCVIRNHSNSSF